MSDAVDATTTSSPTNDLPTPDNATTTTTSSPANDLPTTTTTDCTINENQCNFMTTTPMNTLLNQPPSGAINTDSTALPDTSTSIYTAVATDSTALADTSTLYADPVATDSSGIIGTAESPIPTSLITSPTISPTSSPTSSNSTGSVPFLSTSNRILTFIIIPAITIIILIIVGILIYKRIRKKRQNGTILQFEPMHPHVVIVDADGNSLGKRSSIVSTSNNSFIGNFGGSKNRGPSKMIKVMAYDNDEETESIVAKSSQRTMYYEDFRS